MMPLIEALECLRVMRCVSEEDMARELGLSHETYYRMAAGKPVDVVTLAKILRWMLEP